MQLRSWEALDNMKVLIEKPFITEKSMKLAQSGLYTFLVHKEARKEEIKKVVASKFSVDIVSVKTINMKPVEKLQRSRRGYFMKAGLKKALVQVKSGQKIALFETASEPEVATAENEPVVKEKKSLLKGTKVKIEKEVAEDKKATKKKGAK